MRNGLAWILLASAVPAWAGEGRSLPRGENSPLFLDEVWEAPQGEVQLLSGTDGGRFAFLRLASGELADLAGVDGSAACREWLLSSAGAVLPEEPCSLVFHATGENAPIRVSVGSLVKGNIFSSARSTIRGRHESL
ncbi:MAG: hypothetical protein HUU37_03095 [Bdellovibrionales bacterium]|nr:hypothetical protein [Bdellovibrionales bacterium]